LAQKIGTYEKSIEQYKDCCSLVASARPKTKTKKEKLDEMEKSINIDEVVIKTLNAIETI
jgi:adenylyl- and sulfurtransferase ThiI